MRKRSVIVGTVIATLLIAGGATAALTHPTASPKKAQQLTFADQPKPSDTPDATPATAPAATPDTSTPDTSSSDNVAATDTPTTPAPVDLHAEAAQVINDPAEDYCFEEAMQWRYGWNFDEAYMLHKISQLESIYPTICAGANLVLRTNPNAVLQPDGFRD